ncbi:MAG: sugar phosphate isomerase/epimerase [Desulfuromonadales bacterium]|nr:sugar phosphate isomerase/epimerase [Desulfuromonadales bacterium]
MNRRLYIHLPYRQLDSRLDAFLANRHNAEIAFKGQDLDQLDPGLLKRTADGFREAGLFLTVHGPFLDLNPGALEPYVFEATAIRYRQALVAADRLGAKLLVFHPGYEYWKYGGRAKLWLDASLKFWPPIVALAEEFGIRLAIENIFETEPGTLVQLLDQLDSPLVGHCFDVGHWRLFSDQTLDAWFTPLAKRIIHLHLHDNRGSGDDHLPIGEGDIDFKKLFRLLDSLPNQPSITLEARSAEEADRSLQNLKPYLRR